MRPIVLVIDDHADVRESLDALLRSEGFAVETAENGREALDKLHGGLRPGAILLDLMMPVMDGVEFRQEQLRHPDLAHIPVIVVSSTDRTLRTVGRLQPHAYLQKPVSPEQLVAVLRQHCLK
jgi:CheY-like chemotaxis protein